jgi:histone acetyltransferase MYST1
MINKQDHISYPLVTRTMSTSESEAPSELDIGDRCQVKWRNGRETLWAKVVERRERKKYHNKGELEYYVHYEHHDRRLDEWITYDNFLLETYEKKRDEPPQAAKRRRTLPPVVVSSIPVTEFRMTGGNFHVSGDPSLAELEREHEEITRVKNINKVIIADWEVEAWYYSPFPEEYNVDVLYVCEYCLKHMRHRRTFCQHKLSCTHREPPGKEIYRHDNVSVHEIDGKKAKVYCQNLCLFAKLFLDHKTLFYDTEPFLFYIVCEVDENGSHIVGYFSKEKRSHEDYNLACILTFPQYQKLGYGKFLISLSYELTKRENKVGSPEKPLSDLGKISYRSYWRHVLLHFLAKDFRNLTVKDISLETGIKQEDIISTLQSLNMIRCWKGQHVIFVQQDIIDDYMRENKRLRLCQSEQLNWKPPQESDT